MTRILSYPPRHDYVDRLHGTAGTLVHRDRTWPQLPEFYDPPWLAAHAGDWDLAHLHFTWEQYPPERLTAVLDAHRAGGVPVVWTAHDLRNPHTGSAGDDDVYLRILAERADAVVTLTPGAAGEVARRFGRDAEVIPHGPLLPARPPRPRPPRPHPTGGTRLRVLLHAKSLRANLDVAAVMAAAARAVLAGADVEVVVAAHDTVEVRRELDRLGPGPGVRLELHEPWSLPELVGAIAGADVLLLPYRWGTHSGMVELAADVGTPVIASAVGYLAEQTPIVTVPVTDDRVDVDALADALVGAADGDGLPGPVPWAERQEALDRFVAGHRRLYAELTT